MLPFYFYINLFYFACYYCMLQCQNHRSSCEKLPSKHTKKKQAAIPFRSSSPTQDSPLGVQSEQTRITSLWSIDGFCAQLHPSEDPPRLSTNPRRCTDTTSYHRWDVPSDLRELVNETASDIHAVALSLASLRRASHVRSVPYSPIAMVRWLEVEGCRARRPAVAEGSPL